MTKIILTKMLSKHYKAEVVSSVNMGIKRGEIYGFLGPNGAGKSTVMKMLLGLVQPTSGEIELFGERLLPGSVEHLKRIGHLIEAPVFYEKLTARQNLELHAEYMGYYKEQAIEEALELVQLLGADDKPVKQFSLGMRQRLGIARAILTKPEFLLLDEPINGLDPDGIQLMRNLFRRLRDERGMTILISSHLLSEIEQVADTIGVINGGRLIQEVSMEAVHASSKEYVEIVTSNITHAAYVLTDKLSIGSIKLLGDNKLRIYHMDISLEDLSKALVLNDVPILSMNQRHHTLEEYFFELIRGGEENVASHQAGA
ncbi:bacitracin ABC transporter ATP-binding protein [Paenibacillus sp. FSL H7-0326]|uniref:ATP-binding cassette domain-containing protein n=1 Tax=Paenibacillus sp. FSL H7-0326 TaxID=1921144 RepID=UPI00096D5C65|nr:ABC transporter ATP-binding protein [Paenibacillus sp. FSL H7-0326]OMC66223.1 bacitracin ABC transporter ATP-binding protein [Paenibacillus sp. FSL H7-0326]